MTAQAERLRIKTDIAFKCVFGRNDIKCKEALKKLLSAILATEVTDITYKNPFNIADYETGKEIEFDIAVDTGHKLLDVEMQLNDMLAFPERLAYYGARLLSGTIERGEPYTNLKSSIVIAILDFKLFDDSDSYYGDFCLMEKDRKVMLTDILRIITLEMSKVSDKKAIKEMAEVEKWLVYLKYVGEKSHEKTIEEIIKESEGIQMADNVLREVSADERMRSILLSREKFERDSIAKLQLARFEGEQEGLLKGAINAIKILADMNISVELIAAQICDKYNVNAETALKWYEQTMRDRQ